MGEGEEIWEAHGPANPSSVCKNLLLLYECVIITSIQVDSSIEPTAYGYEDTGCIPESHRMATQHSIISTTY